MKKQFKGGWPIGFYLFFTFITFLGLATVAPATDAFPSTNDQAVTIAVGRWVFAGVNSDTLTTLINQNNARITQIRVEDPNIPTFAVSMVENTGDYASAWWWYFDLDIDTATQLVQGKRLISIDPYMTSAGLRFAVVMVPNEGVQERSWWWYVGVDGPTIGSLLSQNNARPVALRPYNDNGALKFVVIMIANTGVDNKSWEWWPQVSIDFINTRIAAGFRVVSFAPDPFHDWDVILIGSEGEGWSFWFGFSLDQIVPNLLSHNTRLIDLSSYVVQGVRQYAFVELDDSNPPQAPINAESISVRDHAEANGWKGGYHGSYFVESSASPVPRVADNSNFRFEPASSIKVLYLLYTLQQNVPLDGLITYYWPNSSIPNPDVCPPDVVDEIPANAQTTTIEDALKLMMRNSNNILTRAFAIHWGLPAVQAMANNLGMSDTHLNQPLIGCGFRGAVRNELTLNDAAKLYSSVDRGIALSEPARSTFFDILAGGSPSPTDVFGSVVSQEAAVLGKSAVVPEFLAHFNVRWKAGSYGFFLSSTGSPSKVDYAIAGWMSVPFQGLNRTFLFGDFVNDLVVPCDPLIGTCSELGNARNEISANAAESSRKTINEALSTW
jgi:hypothetical protein